MMTPTADIVTAIEGDKIKNGLVFGKFMPPTNGHLYLIDFARASCTNLTVIVLSLDNEPIPGHLRYEWVREIFPACNVIHHTKDMPQEPAHPNDVDFFNAWRDTIAEHTGGIVFDALFASENYGYKVAKAMGTRFIPVDTGRGRVHISGTALRENPLRHWDYLHPVVRPYFLKRIAATGAGMAEKMAAHFDTVFVADYAQTLQNDYAANIPRYIPRDSDAITAARGQRASEDALSRQANRILFTQTPVAGKKYDLVITHDDLDRAVADVISLTGMDVSVRDNR
jgi:NadR type nicotinamide-nucleotide adenylyltransferase